MMWGCFNERKAIALEKIAYSLEDINEKLNLILESQNERKKTCNNQNN